MNDLVKERLLEIVQHYGRSVLRDPEKLKQLLLEKCLESKIEIKLLLDALGDGVVDILISGDSNLSKDELKHRLIHQLQNNYAITPDAAKWAVESWEYALDLNINIVQSVNKEFNRKHKSGIWLLVICGTVLVMLVSGWNILMLVPVVLMTYLSIKFLYWATEPNRAFYRKPIKKKYVVASILLSLLPAFIGSAVISGEIEYSSCYSQTYDYFKSSSDWEKRENARTIANITCGNLEALEGAKFLGIYQTGATSSGILWFFIFIPIFSFLIYDWFAQPKRKWYQPSTTVSDTSKPLKEEMQSKTHATHEILATDLIPVTESNASPTAIEEQSATGNRKRYLKALGFISLVLIPVATYHLIQKINAPTSNSEIAPVSVPPTTPPAATAPQAGTALDCANCPEMVAIPEKSYAIGKYLVTRGQFAAFVKETGYDTGDSCWTFDGSKMKDRSGYNWRNPGFVQDDNHPVACVNLNDAKAYVAWLSQKTGMQYRLPTEEEWEYACLGGQQTLYCGGDDLDMVGWYEDNSGNQTHPVGQKQANGYGLYDMSGNVGEWTDDCLGGDCSRRVTRGGDWFGISLNETATLDGWGNATDRYSNIGFRVVRTPIDSSSTAEIAPISVPPTTPAVALTPPSTESVVTASNTVLPATPPVALTQPSNESTEQQEPIKPQVLSPQHSTDTSNNNPTLSSLSSDVVNPGPGIDCNNHKSASQALICGDPAFLRLDNEMASLYAKAYKLVSNKYALVVENELRLKQREQCSDKACIFDWYTSRNVELRQYIGTQPQVEQTQGFWYYCRDSRAYYPYVRQCMSGWQRVVPQAQYPHQVVVSGNATADWVVVGKAGNPSNSYIIFADPSTIRRSGDIVKMWTMFDFMSMHVVAGRQYLSELVRGEFDCNRERVRKLYRNLHSGNMGHGEVVYSDGNPSDWSPAPPGSVNDGIWKIACGNNG